MMQARTTNTRLVAGLSLVLTALAAGTSSAQTADPKVPFEKYTLDNGLEIVLHQDNTAPLVAVTVWYHVGSGDELPGKSGFAHLFEHMLFQGSVHVGADKHFSTLQSIGATGINGSTNTDRTNYFEVVPSNQLETALWIESDRMGYFLPMLTKESLDNQIEVVKNERRQRVDNVPYGKARTQLYKLLYPKDHPYHNMVIGSMDHLAAASLTDVRNFYKKWYRPANATLVVAGDFEAGNAKTLIQKWFGSFPKSTKPEHRKVAMPVVARTRKVVEDDFVRLRQLNYVWHTPAFFAPGDAEFDILGSVLTSDTGRLYKRLVLEEKLALSVRAGQASQELSSYFIISVTPKQGVDIAKIDAIMGEELDKVISTPVEAKEFNRYVAAQEAAFVWRLQSLASRAGLLQRYNHYVGEPDYITADMDRVRQSSPGKVHTFAAKYLQKKNRIEILTVPSEKAKQRMMRKGAGMRMKKGTRTKGGQ